MLPTLQLDEELQKRLHFLAIFAFCDFFEDLVLVASYEADIPNLIAGSVGMGRLRCR
jgi:hypothetical protein